MSKERELFKRAITALIETRVTDISTKHQSLIDEIEELLAQPEQEPVVGMYRDIFENYKYIINAFEKGVDANYYSREIQQAKSDIRKSCNWLYPLPTDVIDNLAKDLFYSGTFDFRLYAREIENQHGIGKENE